MNGDEEWDEDFLDQLRQVEEIALSSSCSSAFKPNPDPLIPSQSTYIPPFQHHQDSFITHSPPRELSQRPIDFDNRFSNGFASVFPPISLPQDSAKDREIDRLKRELGHVSKKLLDLEQECFELRNERNKNEEQIKFVYSHAAEKDMGIHCSKNTNLECGVPSLDNHVVPQQSRNAKALGNKLGYQICLATSSSKDIGVQTDETGESSNLDLKDDLPSSTNLCNKLLGIWGSTNEQKLGRNLISKLFIACPADFHFLFGRMNINTSSKSGDSVVGEWSSDAALQYHMHSFHASEAAKISCLYSVLTKVSNGLLHLEALLQPLIDLCYLENCTLLRDSFKVEGAKPGNNFKDRVLFSESENEASCASYRLFGTIPSDPQILCKNGVWNVDNGLPLSSVDWVSLFYLLLQIAVSKTEERVRLEAVSIMNVIVLRTNAHAEREIFGQPPVFESIAQFLKREASSHVQKDALHLLYLLLNCPKLLSSVCPSCKEGDNAANEDNNASACENFNAILEGLVDCVTCNGNGVQDIELRRRAVIMLAFLAASVKSGSEILVNHKLPGEKNFLMLILQVLMSEMDVELSVSSEPAENIKARTLLMREVLILLNRLVSNPSYSAIVLRVITASRDTASLIIDIVSRLSQKDQIRRAGDGITLQMRESEIVDLARALKKRIFTYLEI
ncbi:protein SENSITIVE TO UV 2 isoform X2 [Hevea brasiliensis]|uniref:protein SENSITIVE TO UV 2 isoform X2 n=1 Tax=Hevea brasiliensis TaxID=3981 RepID=UPI0025E7151E|nr:protein SENSITIVE TO UV 2 isoform X2 [Hevea brasiliensis]